MRAAATSGNAAQALNLRVRQPPSASQGASRGGSKPARLRVLRWDSGGALTAISFTETNPWRPGGYGSKDF